MLRTGLAIVSLAMVAATFPAPGPGRAPYEGGAPDTFISFAESTTFGPGGSIYDYSTRFAIPNEIGIPHDPTDSGAFTQYTTLWTADTCSSDETTWNAIKALIDTNGSGDVADNTTIWLPANCKVLIFSATETGAGSDFAFNGSDGDNEAPDGINFYCANPATCGFEVRYDAFVGGTDQRWDYTAGDAYGVQINRRAIDIGSTASTPLQSCDWSSGYTLGTKMLQLSTADCQIVLSGGNEFGPGDIIRLVVNDLPQNGTNSFSYMTRVSCVKSYGTGAAGDGTQDPASPSGDECDEITADNQIQIEDPLPFDYNPAGYYWGGTGVGTTFHAHPSGTDTYEVTSGQVVEQIERVGDARGGNGTETNHISEGITFYKVGWSVYPQYIGAKYVNLFDAFETNFYRNVFDGRVGGEALIYVGADDMVGRTNIYGNIFNGGAFKARCFGEVMAIRQRDPIEIDVAVDPTTPCSFSNADDWVGFSTDVVDADLKGKTFVKTPGALDTSGTPDIRTITLDGLDGTCGTGICVDTTPGGIVTHMDNYAMSLFYMGRTSNLQVQHNALIDTTQLVIQDGAMQVVWNSNYEFTNSDFRNVRGPFFHGNAGGPAAIFSLNDMDNAIIIADGSNSPPARHGEGSNHVWFKNRCRDETTPNTWPLGDLDAGTGAYFGTGSCIGMQNIEDQWGSVHEDWSVLLNAGKHVVDTSDVIDNLRNQFDADPTDVSAPHFTYGLAYHRNRSGTGNDQDDNFSIGPVNSTTTRDNDGTDQDENNAVPGGWSTEIGLEPTGIWQKPSWWDSCTGVGTYGAIGAYYDTIGGANGDIAAQVLAEGGTCAGLP